MKKLLLTILLGVSAIYSNAQTNNETLGTNAGSSITTGDYNVIIGDEAAPIMHSGSGNVIVGESAGNSQTSGTESVFIGRSAGFSNTNGFDNVFIGYEAGYSNLTSGDNVFIGTEAGEMNTSGDDNVFVGEEAGTSNISGDDNVFIGEDAGYNNTTANDNTFVGNTAGRMNTTGRQNTFIGNEAGYYNSIGYKNTFVGDSTGIDVGVGRLNTFLGQASGAVTEYADYNTFVGSYSGGDNNRNNGTDNANRNTYVGVFTGFSNREGEDNVGMGAFANYVDPSSMDIINITGRDGATYSLTRRDRTTFIGSQSFPNNNDVITIGYQSRVDGQYAITLGNQSRAQGNYSVAIGQNVDVVNANTMALGGDTATNRLSVGIGTTAANQNASLELADTDKGLLINRVTTAERTTMTTTPASGVALSATDKGLMVYDTDLDAIFTWNGTTWVSVSTNTDQQNLTAATLSGNILTIEIENGTSVNVDLSPILTTLETENANQQAQIDDLLTRVTALEDCACGGTLSVVNPIDDTNRSQQPILYQNIPNPFNGTTSIKYFVPNSYKSAAIVFSNNAGQVIDTIELKVLGDNELYFNSDSLAKGVYYYTLFVDSRKFDTKKMVIE